MRYSTVLNVISFVLLGAILLAVLLTPKFDRAELVDRQASLERRMAELASRFDELQTNVDENIANKSALVESLEPILVDLATNYDVVIEQAKELSERLSNLELRFRSLEIGVDGVDDVNVDGLEEISFIDYFSSRTSENIKLSTLLPKGMLGTAKQHLDSEMIAQDDYDYFLEKALLSGLLPFDSKEEIPDSYHRSLKRLYMFHLTTIKLLEFEQTRVLERLIDSANEHETFLDVRLDEQSIREGQLASQEGQGAGIMKTVILKGSNVARIYRFAYEDNPELQAYFPKSKNVLEHLIRDLYLVAR